MMNNLSNQENISSSVGFQPCNTDPNVVNTVENNGHSKLWNAILNKAPFEEIKRMIEEGADLNEMGTEKDCTGSHEYHEVFYTSYAHPDCLELVKLFIEKGYDYKKITRNGLNAVSNFAGYFDSRVFFYLYSLDQNLIFDN